MNLDIGCGKDKKKDYIGVDIEPFKGVNVIASADALPFKSNTFDTVFTQECITVAEYEGDERLACNELERVLKKGGTLTFNCWTGEPFLKLIPLHKRRKVGTYRPKWWSLSKTTQAEVNPSVFKSHTFYKA
jgi:ubiquinone/menaquinone biosynthesis C-methylase UbiE